MKKVLFTSSEEYKELLRKTNLLDSIMSQVAQATGVDVAAITSEVLADFFESISHLMEGSGGEAVTELRTHNDQLTSQVSTLTNKVNALTSDLEARDLRIAELESVAGTPAVTASPAGDANASGNEDPYLAIAQDKNMTGAERIAAIRKIRNS